MLDIFPRIPLFILYRRFNLPRILPLNLTIALTNRCNFRCKTCRIYKKEDGEEFTLKEFDKTFQSIGKAPYWITFSGGEPFLRKDIVDICRSAYKNCSPQIINIPTNGSFSERIEEGVSNILKDCPHSKIIINLSIDHIGDKHDEIRGYTGSYEKVMDTYRRLKGLKNPNLTVGIHTVVSKFNASDIPEIFKELNGLKPDSYITEIAEERVELGTVGIDITPALDDYGRAIDFVIERIRSLDLRGISRITMAFRLQYYEMVKRVLKTQKEIIPCYAGFASCQITPTGDVWPCCIRAESMGNLRETGYDFKKVWFSRKAEELRKEIKNRNCFCPLANVSYTNMLFSLKSMFAVMLHI